MADLAFLDTPEWNTYVRASELADRGYYVTPLWGSPEWYAARQASPNAPQSSSVPNPEITALPDTTGDASAKATASLT